MGRLERKRAIITGANDVVDGGLSIKADQPED
jgi:hypothetical protein